jgi:hypothetical protein
VTYAKARAHQSHRGTTLLLITDISSNCSCDLNIALAQPTHDSGEQECPKVRCQEPQQDAQDVAAHANQECLSSAIFVRQSSDDWGSNGLQRREQRAQCAAKDNNVISRIDGSREAVLVCVERAQNFGQQSIRGRARCFKLLIEFEEFWEERENECKTDL